MPRVSVLMSVLNGEAFLRRAIDSVLGQTFSDFEFIVIDNASIHTSDDFEERLPYWKKHG